MIVLYGIPGSKRNVTMICLEKLTNDNIVTIPDFDFKRIDIFGDHLPGFEKKIFVILEGIEYEYDKSHSIKINLLNMTIVTNKWIVLLTTAVNLYDSEYRKDLYNQQINRWLNETNYEIVVVESTGYDFPIEHERLHKIIFTITEDLPTSTHYEATSILHALQKIKRENYYENCSHILKVTGRYFLENIENTLKKYEPGLDLYLQKHFSDDWQNCEYYGIRKDLFALFVSPIIYDNKLMENSLSDFTKNKRICRIGPFLNNIRRGGDKRLYEDL